MRIDDVVTLIRERFEEADPRNFPLTGLEPFNAGYRVALAGVLEDIEKIRRQEALEIDELIVSGTELEADFREDLGDAREASELRKEARALRIKLLRQLGRNDEADELEQR